MAFTAGSSEFVYGTPVTAISEATTAIAVDAFDAGTKTAVTSDAPLADGALLIDWAVAPTVGDQIKLFRRDLNIDGANDAPVPDATYLYTYVGSFYVDAVTTSQYLSLQNIPLSKDCEFYIQNSTDQATSASITMTLKITPKSYNVTA